LNTQEKISTLDALPGLLSQGEWTAVAGLFDPLTAIQAKRLAQSAHGDRKLLAVVLDEPDTLLTAEARSVLVAALASVSAVVVAKSGHWQEAIPANADIVIIEDEAAERMRSREFAEFIVHRQEAVRNA
jgi:hypothetical protein